jgi:hypothetical protein
MGVSSASKSQKNVFSPMDKTQILLQYFTNYYQPHLLHREPKYRFDVGLDLCNYLHRKLHSIISYLMKQRLLSQTPDLNLLKRSNQSKGPVGGNQQRNIKSSVHDGPRQFFLLFIQLLTAQHQIKHDPTSLLDKPPSQFLKNTLPQITFSFISINNIS